MRRRGAPESLPMDILPPADALAMRALYFLPVVALARKSFGAGVLSWLFAPAPAAVP